MYSTIRIAHLSAPETYPKYVEVHMDFRDLTALKSLLFQVSS